MNVKWEVAKSRADIYIGNDWYVCYAYTDGNWRVVPPHAKYKFTPVHGIAKDFESAKKMCKKAVQGFNSIVMTGKYER